MPTAPKLPTNQQVQQAASVLETAGWTVIAALMLEGAWSLVRQKVHLVYEAAAIEDRSDADVRAAEVMHGLPLAWL